MLNYRAQSVAQLKEFVERNNIKMGDPSGKYSSFIKNDYLAAIIKHLDSLPAKGFNPYEWFLIGSRDKCCIAVAPGTKYCYLHECRILHGKSILAPCKKCGGGTKTKSRLCTRCNLKIFKKKTTGSSNYKKLRSGNERAGR